MTTHSKATGAAAERLPFLLEIGSEEIPARFMTRALTEIETRLEKLFDDAGLAHAAIRVVGTPRRLAVLCEGVQTRQADREFEVKGPPVRAAFDADGNPTKAAEGFARKNGVAVDECHRIADERGEYIAAVRREVGEETLEVLSRRLPELVLGLPFPKVMRWGDGDIEYPRPLQWLVVLFGDAVVPVEVGPVRSGRRSRGHRTLYANAEVEIPAPGAYVEALEAASVVVDHDRRRSLIEAGVAELLRARESARLIEDDSLLTEIVFLCEHPTPFVGSFEREFFELPPEVIVTALKEHQRYFAVADGESESLLPCFVAVRDGGDRHLDNVRAGNERVLRARLGDALFYWRFDQRRSPDQHAARLADVTWIEGLGSVLDKTRRVKDLIAWLWENGFGDGAPVAPAALRAAEIAKSDQVTEMIRDGKEFTSLEGVIGARYAAAAGEDESVCRAIEEQYLPRSSGDRLPSDGIGRVLSAADRLDTLAGCWLAGFAPTGAKDPYALRRHALAVVRILIDGGLRVSLRAIIARALSAFETDAATAEGAVDGLATFFRKRLAGYLVESCGCLPEAVRAVLDLHGDDPADALAWARVLAGFRDEENFRLLATGFKRCGNILEGRFLEKDQRSGSLQRWLAGGSGAKGEDFTGLVEEEEIELRQQVAAVTSELADARAAGDYQRICRLLSDLGPTIDDFFDSVRVNVTNEEIKSLRHAFLREIHALFADFADFSEIAPIR